MAVKFRTKTIVSTDAFFKAKGLFEGGDGSYEDVPGIIYKANPHSQFYIDIRFFGSAYSGPDQFKIRITGFTPSYSPPQSFLSWGYLNVNNQRFVFKDNLDTAPQNVEWNPVAVGGNSLVDDSQVSYIGGEFHIFGLVQNDTDNETEVKLQIAPVNVLFNPPRVEGAKMIITEILQDTQNNSISIMSNCGCCMNAELSCCQETIQIQTGNPSTEISWKIDDGIGGVYTGTFATDADGLGEITIGDGLDLPDGFIDAPRSIRLEFTDVRPKISSKVECVDIDIVGGAYLAINQIGESAS